MSEEMSRRSFMKLTYNSFLGLFVPDLKKISRAPYPDVGLPELTSSWEIMLQRPIGRLDISGWGFRNPDPNEPFYDPWGITDLLERNGWTLQELHSDRATRLVIGETRVPAMAPLPTGSGDGGAYQIFGKQTLPIVGMQIKDGSMFFLAGARGVRYAPDHIGIRVGSTTGDRSGEQYIDIAQNAKWTATDETSPYFPVLLKIASGTLTRDVRFISDANRSIQQNSPSEYVTRYGGLLELAEPVVEIKQDAQVLADSDVAFRNGVYQLTGGAKPIVLDRMTRATVTYFTPVYQPDVGSPTRVIAQVRIDNSVVKKRVHRAWVLPEDFTDVSFGEFMSGYLGIAGLGAATYGAGKLIRRLGGSSE